MQGGSLGPPIIEQIVNKVEANLAPFGRGRRSVWTKMPRHLATLSGCEDVAWDCSMSAHRSRPKKPSQHPLALTTGFCKHKKLGKGETDSTWFLAS